METTKRGLVWPLERGAAASPAAHPALRLRLATFALATALGLAVSWRVLSESGVVGFVHDWSIAPFAEQHLALLRQTFDGWYRWGLGAPVAYPFEYPLRLAFGLVAAFGIGGAAISKAIVLLVPAAAFLAAVYLGRTCGLPYAAAWLCGAFYALDPVMLNKLVSGQTAYLVGYACLPIAPALFLRACERSSALLGGIALGGVLALVSMEVQLGVLGVALIALLAVFSTSVPVRVRLGLTATALFTLALVEVPTIAWATHGIGGLTGLEQFGHGAAWLNANSLWPADALRLIGYPAQYDVLSIGSWMDVWRPVSWLVVLAAVAGLATLRGAIRPTLFVCAAAALVFACGTTTPLGGAMTWVFDRFSSAQVFRELYHVMALVSLAYAVGIGAAFAYVARTRYASLAGGVLTLAVAAYCAPMLSGDASGWLEAVPIDRYLAPAFHAEGRGDGRVAWFPMDDPLAFDDRGSGTDPMAVTERGSLWLYSLAWPLTAVDSVARTGDDDALRRELQALGVAAAVDRDRLHSRYRSLPRVADLADRFFGSDLVLGRTLGATTEYGAGLHGYRIANPLPIERIVKRYAIVPRRMSVIADASLAGAATFGYAQSLPGNRVPYDVYVDNGDRAFEALQVAGLTRFVREPRVDPFTGFAGGDLWWWYRPQYADARRFSLAVGRGGTTFVSAASAAMHDATIVVAWIATPAGGRLEVRCGRAREVLDTGGAWGGWYSAAVRCGPLAAAARARLTALDAGAETALRGAQIVEGTAYEAARGKFDATLRGAARVVALGEPYVVGSTVLRQGRTNELGALAPRTAAVLMLQRRADSRPAAVRVVGTDGFVFAWRRFSAGQSRIAVPLVAGNDAMHVVTPARIASWQLLGAQAKVAPLRPASRATPSSERLLVADQTFDGGWRAAGAVAHLASALGTNVFVLPQGAAGDLSYAYAVQYHIAFAVGTIVLVLALSLGVGFAGARRP